MPLKARDGLGVSRPPSPPAYEPGTLRTVFFLRVVVLVDFFGGADLSGSCICSAVSSLAAGAFGLVALLAVLLAAGFPDFFAVLLLLLVVRLRLGVALPGFFARARLAAAAVPASRVSWAGTPCLSGST